MVRLALSAHRVYWSLRVCWVLPVALADRSVPGRMKQEWMKVCVIMKKEGPYISAMTNLVLKHEHAHIHEPNQNKQTNKKEMLSGDRHLGEWNLPFVIRSRSHILPKVPVLCVCVKGE